MNYHLRHAGSPKHLENLSFAQILHGLETGRWSGSDEVHAVGDERWQALEDHPDFVEAVESLEGPPAPRDDEEAHLDMNAMIDVCLVLLIFFILTTTYATAVQKVVPVPAKESDGKKARTVG